ncbi:MAG: glycosyltransferase family 4 protein [Bacteroidales bacterium]|nr:glycosyltransferase family 4 protein [Bacteroidales bacterium]
MEFNLQEYLRDKRLLFITAQTYPSMAGSSRNAFYFAKYLSNFARWTTIIGLNSDSEEFEEEDYEKLKVKRIPFNSQNTFRKVTSIPQLLSQTRQSISRSDIVFFYGGYIPGLHFLLFEANRLQKTTIFRSSVMGGDDILSIAKRNPVAWLYRKRIYKNISMYFAINRIFEERWRAKMKNRVMVFRSFQGVNSDVFYIMEENERKILKKQFDIPEDVPVILSSGYLVNRKGYPFLFKELAKLDIPFVYLVAGAHRRERQHKITNKEYREMNRLYFEGKRLLGDKVKFLGVVQRMERIYPIADIFLHGAKGEGSPNVLFEAMAMGRPVIIQKNKGLVTELLTHDENALVYNDYEEIPGLVKYVFENPLKAASIGHNGAFIIEENYSFETVASNLFENLVD